MQNKEDYFKGVDFIKIAFLILFFFGAMVMISQVRGEDNKTKEEWTTQLLYDTTNACYQGTYRWILMANPSLIGQQPPPIVQRQMIQHCFCVMDKIRDEYNHKKNVELIETGFSIGQLFMNKSYECMSEFDSMRGIFVMRSDNSTMKDNETEVIPTEPEGQEESTPDEELEQEQSIFKG